MSNDLIVVKANSLIEASYRLSIDEIRILALTIGTMDPRSNQKIFDFTVADFVREFPEISIDNAYKQIQSAIKRIYDRSVKTEDEYRVTEFRWVSSRTYFKKEGRFRIAMTDEVMPYLTQLKGQFTQYQLKNIAYFNSVHSIRIYELITQYRSRGERFISIDDLKKWLQVEDKYPRFNNFKQWVLDPAVEEINEKSDLLVDVEFERVGRRISNVKFTFSVKQAVEKPKKSAKSDEISPVKIRGKLPQRPPVKPNSHEEGVFFRACETQIRNGWKEHLGLENWRSCLDLLPDSELELLQKYYKGIGDDLYKQIKKILYSRTEKS